MQRAQGGPPRYAQLAGTIRGQILSGGLAAGDRIPSGPELMDAHGVSNTTASKALELLVAEGLIVRRPGVGSFVADGVEPASEMIAAAAGAVVSARWPRPGELAGAPPGTIALVVRIPGRPEALYPADRASVVLGARAPG